MLLGQLGLGGDGIKRIEAQAQFNGSGNTTTPSGRPFRLRCGRCFDCLD
jgi:hypothetical protein